MEPLRPCKVGFIFGRDGEVSLRNSWTVEIEFIEFMTFITLFITLFIVTALV